MTLSFWKVPFSAQEVLDLMQECDSLAEFENRFCELAEERSRRGDAYGIWMTTEESPARRGWLRKILLRRSARRRKSYGRVVAGRYLGDTAPKERYEPTSLE